MLQPKLRFKNFNEEWVEKKIEEFYPFIRNGFVGIATPFYCEKGVKYLQSNNIHDGKINEKILKYITLEFHQKNIKNELKEDDILMVQSGHAGECAVVGKKYIGCNCHALIILSSNKRSNSYFVSYYLNSEKGKKSLIPLLIGNTIIHILASDIKKHKIFFPRLEEQEKIADFLSSVDVKINLTENKLELLKEYKKEIMQKIFNRELRFKDENGNDYPNWEEKKLGDIVQSISNGISINQNFDKIGYKVTRIETISEAKINLKRIGYITTDKNIKEYKLNIGDLLFSNINSVEHIGKLAYVDKDYNLYHGMNLLRIVFKENLNSKYFYYLLTERKYKKLFEKLCNKAVSQASINQTELSKIKVYNPCLEEQQKIADFFSSIDNKIEKISDELENLKEFKKGLLQQMFI